jgi:hypothetical protein
MYRAGTRLNLGSENVGEGSIWDEEWPQDLAIPITAQEVVFALNRGDESLAPDQDNDANLEPDLVATSTISQTSVSDLHHQYTPVTEACFVPPWSGWGSFEPGAIYLLPWT